MKDNTNERNWFLCPKCGQKICQLSNEAKSYGLYFRCKKCHNEVEIKVNVNSEGIIA
jgi:predicted RNA-binding Zn-ribbon protein involved in translation (DUF1610 family)